MKKTLAVLSFSLAAGLDSARADSIVSNGDFSGATYGTGNQVLPSGWTAGGDLSYPDWVYQNGSGYYYPDDPAGTTAHLEIGTNNGRLNTGATLTQTLATVKNEIYTLSFYYAETYATGGLAALWNGTTEFSETGSALTTPLTGVSGDQYGSWVEVSYTVKATSSTTTLEFKAYDTSIGVGLADVMVTPATVPEPSTLLMCGLGVASIGLGRLGGRRPLNTLK